MFHKAQALLNAFMKYKNMHQCNRRDANCARGFYHHGCRVRN